MNNIDVQRSEPTMVYRMFDKDQTLLYVGITNNWKNRLHQHRQDKWWLGDVHEVTFERFTTRDDALRAEKDAIECEGPAYNVMLAKVSPNNRREDRQSLRMVLQNVNSYNSFYQLREIAARHPGQTLFEWQCGRSVSEIARVDLCDELYSDLDKFCRLWRSAMYGVVIGIAGSSMKLGHVESFFDQAEAAKVKAERDARLKAVEAVEQTKRDQQWAAQFAQDVGIQLRTDGWISATSLRHLYDQWAERHGRWSASFKTAARSLRAAGCTPQRQNGIRGWAGIAH